MATTINVLPTGTVYYTEFRSSVRRTGSVIILPAEVYSESGPSRYSFRSVYSYPKSTAEFIRARNSTEGLGGSVVYSDILFVDIDGSADSVASFRQRLVSAGLGFSLWHTGRRGGHFHIPIVPMFGRSVPEDQKDWVRTMAGEGVADLSIYSAAGQWRLPYAVHEKNPGHLKVPVETVPGQLLKIPRSIAPPPVFRRNRGSQVTKETWVSNLSLPRTAGQRSPHIYILCCNALALGIELDELTDCVLVWSQRYCTPPHPDEYVIAKVDQTYAQLQGSIRRRRGKPNSLPLEGAQEGSQPAEPGFLQSAQQVQGGKES